MSVFRPGVAVTYNGRHVEFETLHYINDDLHHFGYHNDQEYHTIRYWILNYQNGGALPGTTKFYSVYSGEQITFLKLLDDLYTMYVMASNWYDLTDDETVESTLDDLASVAVNLFPVHPIHIGRFNMNPDVPGIDRENLLEWQHLENILDGEVIDLTMDDFEDIQYD